MLHGSCTGRAQRLGTLSDPWRAANGQYRTTRRRSLRRTASWYTFCRKSNVACLVPSSSFIYHSSLTPSLLLLTSRKRPRSAMEGGSAGYQTSRRWSYQSVLAHLPLLRLNVTVDPRGSAIGSDHFGEGPTNPIQPSVEICALCQTGSRRPQPIVISILGSRAGPVKAVYARS